MTSPVVPPGGRVSGIPPALDEAVLRAMSRNPRDRFPCVRSFAAALTEAASTPACMTLAPQFSVASSPIEDTLMDLRADEPADGYVATFDGIASIVRGDTMAMLWKASPNVGRMSSLFDLVDRLAGRRPEGILMLTIILPTANPPDREARLENDRRIRRMRSSIRALSTVIPGNGVFQTLLRSVIRAMMLPHLRCDARRLHDRHDDWKNTIKTSARIRRM
jgi:hypothetical protein